MKKLVLFLMVIGAVALMTSCLKGETHEESFDYFLIKEDRVGVAYGDGAGGPVTSREIQLGLATAGSAVVDLRLGEFYLFPVRWEKEFGTTPLSIGDNTIQALNVERLGPIVEIPRRSLSLSAAPEEPTGFAFDGVELVWPFPDREFWNDHWIFYYGYTSGSQAHNISFHVRERAEGSANNNKVDIDIRIDNLTSGTERRTTHAALNMAPVRAANTGREIEVTFHYLEKRSQGEPLAREIRLINWDLRTPQQ
jgi:hypothetical protein